MWSITSNLIFNRLIITNLFSFEIGFEVRTLIIFVEHEKIFQDFTFS